MKVTVIFDNFGPYHLARLHAAARVFDLTAVEAAAGSAEYAWENKTRADNFKSVTLFKKGTSRDLRWRELKAKMDAALDSVRPQVVFIPGWSGCTAFAALHWCIRHKIPAVAMSESTEWDEKRIGWKEWVKRKLVGLCAAALVGGNSHKDYLMKLGLSPDRIFLGYDAVDNQYFAQGTNDVRSRKPEIRTKFKLPEKYFLASARFVEKKNLPRLVEGYARYRKLAAAKSEIGNQKTVIWNLVLLGDGVLRETLNSQLSTLNLHDHVQMPGFKQYPDLPAYYALAGAFIHASTTEQWGLVVNEAMASGLPVLVSHRCGCARDLVQKGKNGFTFDPCDVEELAQLMLKISDFRFPISEFGAESARIIANWGPEQFAAGLKDSAMFALKRTPQSTTLLDHLLLKALVLR